MVLVCAVTFCWYLIGIGGISYTYCNLQHALAITILVFLDVPNGIFRCTYWYFKMYLYQLGFYHNKEKLSIGFIYQPPFLVSDQWSLCILSEITWVLRGKYRHRLSQTSSQKLGRHALHRVRSV